MAQLGRNRFRVLLHTPDRMLHRVGCQHAVAATRRARTHPKQSVRARNNLQSGSDPSIANFCSGCGVNPMITTPYA